MPSDTLQVRVRDLGIKKVIDTYPPKLVTRLYGTISVNENAYKQLNRWLGGKIVAMAPLARDDLYVWIRQWNGELWLYRVATDAYVDFDPAQVLEYVRSLIPDFEPIKAGALYGRGVYMEQGAVYAEGVWGIQDNNNIIKGIWIRTGDDGYTAIRIRPFYLFPEEISAVVLPNTVSRRLHVSADTIYERVRQDVDGSLATLKSFELDKLKDYPVPFTVINKLSKKVYDLPHKWRHIAPRYGENAYSLALALGRCLTSASAERRERIARLLVLLTSDPVAFIEAYSQEEGAKPRGLEPEVEEEE